MTYHSSPGNNSPECWRAVWMYKWTKQQQWLSETNSSIYSLGLPTPSSLSHIVAHPPLSSLCCPRLPSHHSSYKCDVCDAPLIVALILAECTLFGVERQKHFQEINLRDNVPTILYKILAKKSSSFIIEAFRFLILVDIFNKLWENKNYLTICVYHKYLSPV